MKYPNLKNEPILDAAFRGFRANNSVSTLPKITSLLLPEEYELLPSTTELFELEFAFYEYKLLSKRDIIQRGGFFKSIDRIYTHHYAICSNNSELTWQGRSKITRAYFKEGSFSTGYATHGLFPYRGKFHPQLIKGILNIIGVQPGETILDPMCGSGTLNVEASIMGINSIGFERSPFCVLMSKTKVEALKCNNNQLSAILSNSRGHHEALRHNQSVPADYYYNSDYIPEKNISLLAFLDAMGYARRCSKSIDVLFPQVLQRYVGQINSFIQVRDKLDLNIANVRIESGDARNLPLADNMVDAIVTSPPYSFAIDYVDNDKPQLEYLGYDVYELRNEMIGLNGKGTKEKLAIYFADMNEVLREMARVLKVGKYAIVIIGTNDIQTGGVRLETKVEEMALTHGFILDKKMEKPIKGIQNTMKDEYILFLRKTI